MPEEPFFFVAVVIIALLFFICYRFSQAFALFRHRRGRETKTSSDASREAPERARKDTPKEVKLHKGSYPSVRLSGEVSQAFT